MNDEKHHALCFLLQCGSLVPSQRRFTPHKTKTESPKGSPRWEVGPATTRLATRGQSQESKTEGARL